MLVGADPNDMLAVAEVSPMVMADDFFFMAAESYQIRPVLALLPSHLFLLVGTDPIDAYYFPAECVAPNPVSLISNGFSSGSLLLIFTLRSGRLWLWVQR